MSSVTAVPLQPLPKGTVLKLWIGILLLLLIAAGLAWLGTSKFQYTTVDSGARYRVIEAGEGDKVAPDDLVRIHVQITKVADGRVLASTLRSGQPESVTVNMPFPGLRDVMLQMQEGGAYEIFTTAQQATGDPVPPGQPIQSDDPLKFEIRVVGISPGMGAMQPIMGPEGAGPGGPGGPPPGAMPPEAMPPPGAVPPGGPGAP